MFFFVGKILKCAGTESASRPDERSNGCTFCAHDEFMIRDYKMGSLYAKLTRLNFNQIINLQHIYTLMLPCNNGLMFINLKDMWSLQPDPYLSQRRYQTIRM